MKILTHPLVSGSSSPIGSDGSHGGPFTAATRGVRRVSGGAAWATSCTGGIHEVVDGAGRLDRRESSRRGALAA